MSDSFTFDGAERGGLTRASAIRRPFVDETVHPPGHGVYAMIRPGVVVLRRHPGEDGDEDRPHRPDRRGNIGNKT